MKIRFVLISLVFFLISFNAFGQGCEYDNQCRGNRICEDGRCVSPDRTPSRPDNGGPIDDRRNNLPKYCCTQAGRFGPYPNPNQLGQSVPVGGYCSAPTTFGLMPGQACY